MTLNGMEEIKGIKWNKRMEEIKKVYVKVGENLYDSFEYHTLVGRNQLYSI